MNWPTRTFFLFFFALSTLFSCENPDVALDLEGETILGTAFTDTITVKAATVLLNDSILGFKRGNLLTGQTTDPIFGSQMATAFTELGLGSTSFTEPTTATIDSMVLSLDYEEYYGDTTQNLTVRVHRLQQAFQEDQIYFANRDMTYQATPLGTRTFKPTPKKVVKTYNADSSAIVRLPVPLRIKLNNGLANEILAQRETVLANQTAFTNFLPGLALTTDNDAKAVLGFSPESDSTYLRIYYQASGKKYRFNILLGGNRNRLNRVTGNLANTPLAALQKSGDSIASGASNNQIYVQESTGLKAKIRFPYIETLKEKLNGAYVNRAELILPLAPASGSNNSPYLYLYETNKTNKILRFGGAPRSVASDGAFYPAGYGSPAPLLYTPSSKTYILNVTSYVQALIYGIRPIYSTSNGSRELAPSNGLIISPASLSPSASSSWNDLLGLQTLRQTIISTAPGNAIKLRLYYSAKK